jgi:CDP-diglyceride synthetase
MTADEEPPLVGSYPRAEAKPKFCPECGTPVRANDQFCSQCGRRFGPAPARPAAGQYNSWDGYAIASICCAIAALFAAPVIGSICAIYFGKRAQENIRRNPGLQGDGLAQAGIFIGWASIIIGIFFVMIGLSLLSGWR